VRVYVNTEAGFAARQLSARVALIEGAQVVQVFHKRTVSSSSTESSYTSTFNVTVPGELITPTVRYAVEIVECEGSTGSQFSPRFPVSGDEPLEARDTGRLRVQFIPLLANGSTPDTSSGFLDVYKQYMERMYPIAGMDYTVGEPLSVSTISATSSGSWSNALDDVSARHQSDNAPNDLYYYGLFQPSGNFFQGGCIAGIGWVPGAGSGSRHSRASLGLSTGDRSSAGVMAHEVGHNHGRPHSPCGGVANPDNNFPHNGATIGWWGFETPDTLVPTNYTDIMGYCNNQWVSDYVYNLFADRVETINNSVFEIVNTPELRWLVALSDPSGARWRRQFPWPEHPAGDPDSARVIDANANLIAELTVYRTEIDHGGASFHIPPPAAGWHSILLSDGQVLRFADFAYVP
jgi:hypothetical protein